MAEQSDFKIMSKLLLVMIFIISIHANFLRNRPDAIRCGAVNDEGAIFFPYLLNEGGVSYYTQIYSKEFRSVAFNADGSYNFGVGYYEARKGCENKNLQTLKIEGRTFNLDNSGFEVRMSKLEQEVSAVKLKNTELNTKIAKLEQDLSAVKKNNQSNKQSANLLNSFWEYEQLKQKWKQEFKMYILTEIKTNGIQIGSKWRIKQQNDYLIVRDNDSSKTKDSRYAFYPNTYSDLK